MKGAVTMAGGDAGSPIREFAAGHPTVTAVVIVVTAVCIAAGPLTVALLTFRERRLQPLLAAGTAAVGTDLVSTVIARIWPRPRPFIAFHFAPLFPHVNNASFPSDTTALAAAAAVVTLLLWRRGGVVLLAGAAEVGLGCVWVGVHYVDDVVAGYCLGVLAGLAGWGITMWPPVASQIARLEARVAPSHRPGA